MLFTKVIFPINDTEYFAILVPHAQITNLRMCERIQGFFYRANKRIPILDHYNCIESELDGLMGNGLVESIFVSVEPMGLKLSYIMKTVPFF